MISRFLVESLAMQKTSLPRPATCSPAWLAILLLLVMLGQAVLPTMASMQAGSSPALWDEICSVYGGRQTGPDNNDPAPVGHHISCPACLHMVGDLVLATALSAIALRLFLLREVSGPSFLAALPYSLRFTPQARAPPAF